MTGKITPEARVTVNLGPRSYDVAVGSGTLAALGETVATSVAAKPGRVVLAFDRGLPGQTVEAADGALRAAGYSPVRFGVTATEELKSLDQLGALLAFMAAERVERTEPVVALGGGIVGDLAGFAAASYRRGVPFIQCPTTLLSMVDASVGGKTGVNLPGPGGTLLKNMAGAFHQPRAVVIDVDTLKSLPDRHFRAGLAECIKHGMISGAWGDAPLGEWTASRLGQILARDAATLVELIARNVRVKAAVVERDEREEAPEGGRALLNLGHTFAHAIETIPTLTPDGNPTHAPLLHGEAVGLGLVAASACAEAAGHAAGTQGVTRTLVSGAGLPTRIAGLPAAPELLARMAHDKKVSGGRPRLVLPTSPGHAAVFGDVPESAVRAGWDALRE